MRRTELARSLVNAKTDRERTRLLRTNTRLADGRLADEIRKICYASWTSEPATARAASRAANVLLAASPTDDVAAAAAWVSGIANITKGQFDDAVNDLSRAGLVLKRLGRDLESAQTLVPTILALAATGRYDQAVKAGRSALKIFTAAGDHLAAGKIEMNLSNIAARRSRLREAEQRGLAALELFASAGEPTWQAMAENDLANTYMELTDFPKAQHFYELALATARSANMLVTEAEVEASIGNLALLRGEYAEALRYLELSRRKYDGLAMPHQSAIADLEIAGIYATLNLHTDACAIYARIADAFRRLKMRGEEARSRLEFGRSAAATGKTRAARRELTRAAKLYEAENDGRGRDAVLIQTARLAFGIGRFAEAVDMLGPLRSSGKTSDRQTLAADLLAAESMRRSGRLNEAEQIFDEADKTARRTGQIDVQRLAIWSLAEIASSRGDDETAEWRFKAAIDLTEKMREPLASDEFAMAFLADKLDAYEGLARLHLRRGRLREAFEVTESSRSRSLLDAISAAQTTSMRPRQLEHRLAEIRTQLNWFYKRLDEDESGNTAREIVRRERAIAELSRRIGSVSAKGKRKKSLFSLALLQRELGTRQTLIEYSDDGGDISAFVITRGTIQHFAKLCTTPEVSERLADLQFQFGCCRFGMEKLGKFKAELKRRVDLGLALLYDKLIRPLEHALVGRNLIFVPRGPLNYVPFPALYDGRRYLVERFTVSQAPGAAVWLQLRRRKRASRKTALLIGFAGESIPLVEDEIDALKGKLANATALKGKNATFAAFTEAAGDYAFIHIACHGQFRTDNPMFSSLHLADGWITVRDITLGQLRADLVTLSACESGMSGLFVGDETLGLVRGFLSAGARSMIVSLWTVNDAAAAELMLVMYASIENGNSPAAALRAAQLSFIERGEHPYLWSPFIAIGN